MEGEAVSESTPMKEDFRWTASSLLWAPSVVASMSSSSSSESRLQNLLLFNHSSLRLRLNMENALSPVTSWSTARNFGSLGIKEGPKYIQEKVGFKTHLSLNSSLERVV